MATFARGFFFTEPQFCSSIGNGAEVRIFILSGPNLKSCYCLDDLSLWAQRLPVWS